MEDKKQAKQQQKDFKSIRNYRKSNSSRYLNFDLF